jgi:LPS O-antigen subunit length determinant protein (WzzB/FepE family)
MSDEPNLFETIAQAFRDNGLTAAITALIAGIIALLASVTRKAFTNDAMLARMDRELLAERNRVDRQRAEDRKNDADRLERIEADIRAMRDLMFEAFQRGRTD